MSVVHGGAWVIGAKVGLYCLGTMAAFVTHSMDLLGDTEIFYFRTLVLVCLPFSFATYLYVKRNIDNTYTSYKSGVDYGLSNLEKVASRTAAKSTFWKICITNFLLLAIHFYLGETWPCCFGPVVVVTCFLDNNEYLSIFVKGHIKKPPVGIPRSTSGKLM